MSSIHQVDGHALTLLHNSEEYFSRLIAAIDSSTRSVYLETYIYAADATGRKFSDALQRAAKRGVAVRLLLDGYGSAELPQQWIDEMLAADIEVLWFRKEVGRFSFRRYHLRRLHRKLALVDEHIAFVSGINIEDDVIADYEISGDEIANDGIPGAPITAPRLDYAVEVQGETVNRINASMKRLWMLVSWTNFRRQRVHATSMAAQGDSTKQSVIFLTRDNLRHRRDIEQAYFKAIAAAQQEIIIANAYFLPGFRLRRALVKAAQRGVRVVLLLQGRIEYRLQHYATLALYEQLLSAGVEIYQYHISFLHAKVAVIDSHWATVGSSNIDPFSLLLAREANLVVNDAGFAEALRASLMHQIEQGARPVSPSLWREYGLWARFMMFICYALIRFLTGVTGYARRRDNVG